MGEANIKAEAVDQATITAIQQQQQEAWAIQQKEAVYVNGFALQANLDGTTRMAFNEKTRADLPGTVRCALLMPDPVMDQFIETLVDIRAKQKDAMVPPVTSPPPVTEPTSAFPGTAQIG